MRQKGTWEDGLFEELEVLVGDESVGWVFELLLDEVFEVDDGGNFDWQLEGLVVRDEHQVGSKP